MKKNNSFLKNVFFLLLIFFPAEIFSFEINPDFCPKIERFKRDDINFLQLQASVKNNDLLYFAQKETFPEFFVYKCNSKDTFITLASRTGIPYDTISTLNSISDTSVSLENVELVIPSVKGIFIPEKPGNPVEILLYKEYEQILDEKPVFTLNNRKFYFLEGKRFTPYQRLFFLDNAFSLPLDTKIITSAFGFRESPLYGIWKQHNGIDFRAKKGDSVYSCKNGTVSFVKKNDEIFGNYLIISHDSGITSVYAHLSKILVKTGEVVRGRQLIGYAGDTGKVTASHLHFEIRQGGRAIDPVKVLPE